MSRIFWFILGIFFCLFFVEPQNYFVATQNPKGMVVVDHSNIAVAKVNKKNDWIVPPNVILCPNSPYSLEELQDALDFWKGLSHRFGKIEKEDSCDRKVHGNIYVTGDRIIRWFGKDIPVGKGRYVGLAVPYLNKNNFIVAAHISIPFKYYMVLEHEIGHALGYLHVDDPEHLMHPKIGRPELMVYGLENGGRNAKR